MCLAGAELSVNLTLFKHKSSEWQASRGLELNADVDTQDIDIQSVNQNPSPGRLELNN